MQQINFINYEEAKKQQLELSKKLVLKNSFESLNSIKTIAAFDIALKYNPRFIAQGNIQVAYAVCLIFSFPDFQPMNQYHHIAEMTLPYLPGFLSFRESPIYLELINKFKINADLFIFDGHGIAHPRRLGIASHMGLILNKPSIGCGKSLLYGSYDQQDLTQEKETKLKSPDGELLGYALQTKIKTKPVFISPGHLIDHQTALTIIKSSCDNYRIPKATRLADKYSKEIKKLEANR